MKIREVTLTQTEMPCKFCEKSSQYSPLQEMESHGVRVYFCHDCQAEYLYWSDGGSLSTSLYTTINDKMYRWTVSNNFNAILWYVTDPGTPGVRKNKSLKFIKEFVNQAEVTTITPQNIVDKLKTYLLFL